MQNAAHDDGISNLLYLFSDYLNMAGYEIPRNRGLKGPQQRHRLYVHVGI